MRKLILGRGGNWDGPELAGIQSMGDAAYGSAFSGRVLDLENQHHRGVPALVMLRQAGQAALPFSQLFVVFLLRQYCAVVHCLQLWRGCTRYIWARIRVGRRVRALPLPYGKSRKV